MSRIVGGKKREINCVCPLCWAAPFFWLRLVFLAAHLSHFSLPFFFFLTLFNVFGGTVDGMPRVGKLLRKDDNIVFVYSWHVGHHLYLKEGKVVAGTHNNFRVVFLLAKQKVNTRTTFQIKIVYFVRVRYFWVFSSSVCAKYLYKRQSIKTPTFSADLRRTHDVSFTRR